MFDEENDRIYFIYLDIILNYRKLRHVVGYVLFRFSFSDITDRLKVNKKWKCITCNPQVFIQRSRCQHSQHQASGPLLDFNQTIPHMIKWEISKNFFTKEFIIFTRTQHFKLNTSQRPNYLTQLSKKKKNVWKNSLNTFYI